MKAAGIYWILNWAPMWATALALYFLIIGILFVLRDYFEKLPYNISVASQQGDLALIGSILIAVEIIKRHPEIRPWIGLQVMFICLGVFIGAVTFEMSSVEKREITVADTYHSFVIIPLLVFLLGASLLVVYSYGTLVEKIFFFLFPAIWFSLVCFDAKTGRLEQPEWLAKHGICVPIKRVK